MPPWIAPVGPFGLNCMIAIFDHELAVAPRPGRTAAMFDGFALCPEARNRLVVMFAHQVPLPIPRLDKITLAIHRNLRAIASSKNAFRKRGFQTAAALLRRQKCNAGNGRAALFWCGDRI